MEIITDVPSIGYVTGVSAFRVNTQSSNPRGVFFKPDGTKMYVVELLGTINEYDLSTAWDVASSVFLQSFDTTAQDNRPTGMFFKPDGTKMYVVGSTTDSVHEYDLSVAWDVTSAVILQNFSVSAQDRTPSSVLFKPDGTKMYINGNWDEEISEYDLSTAWDVTSAVFLQFFDLSTEDGNPEATIFKPDGTKMYMLGGNSNNINEYDLSTAWDVTSAVYLQNVDISPEDIFSKGLFFKPDGTRAYLIGDNGNRVYEYRLGTAWSISSILKPSYDNVSFSLASQDTDTQGMFFKPDGTKMYVTGASDNDVNEYNLSTAWDVSSASFLQNFDVSAQSTSLRDISFKLDGTKMYVVGGNYIYEYDLSTVWDVSSAVYLQNFNIASGPSNSPNGLTFKPDGTKMYTTDIFGRTIYEYDLSVAWDVTSAVYLQEFDSSGNDSQTRDLFFKPDGTKMYIIGASNDRVVIFDLSTAWDISSADSSDVFDVGLQASNPFRLIFKPDGSKLYALDDTNTIYQYSTGLSFNTSITWENDVIWEANTAPNTLNKQNLIIEFYSPNNGTIIYGIVRINKDNT